MISNVRVYGLEESMIASGYPMLEDSLTEEEFQFEVRNLKLNFALCKSLKEKGITPKMVTNERLAKAYKHYCRVLNLGNAKENSGHDSFAKGVKVQFDLTATHVFMPQFMRYHFQDIISLKWAC